MRSVLSLIFLLIKRIRFKHNNSPIKQRIPKITGMFINQFYLIDKLEKVDFRYWLQSIKINLSIELK